MTTLEGLRRQIHSVDELGSIVRTMKSLASVKVRQYERAARSLALFDETVELGFQVLLRRLPLEEIAQRRGVRRRVAAVVLGTDQGMCGPFNDRIVSFARSQWSANGGEDMRGPVLAVGHRAADLLIDSELAPDDILAMPTSLSAVTGIVEQLLIRVEKWRASDRFDRLLVFHNRRSPGTLSRPHVLQHLPLPMQWLRGLASRPWSGPSLPIFTLEPGAMLSQFIQQHLFGTLYRAVVESLESENVSRLEAMHAAETNIAELLENLRAAFRQERQASIMAELLDILSGYEATRE